MAIVTIRQKVKRQHKQQGRLMRVTDWTHEYLRALKERSGIPMNEALEAVLRQVTVKEARP